MKNFSLLPLALFCVFGVTQIAQAQNAVPSVAPNVKSPVDRPPVEKQEEENLASCQARFQKQNIPQSQYHSFMDSCTSANTASQTSTSPSKLPGLAPTLRVTPPTSAASATTKQ